MPSRHARSAAGKTSTPRKAPVRTPKVVATKKAATEAPPMKAKPTKSVLTKSPAQKVTSPKAVVEAAAPQKAVPVKKSPSKKVAAKEAGPLKRKTANRVEAPAPVSKTIAPVTVATRPVKVSAADAVRDAGKVRSKLVRDSFTMPQQDFGLIAALKERALNFKRPPPRKANFCERGCRRSSTSLMGSCAPRLIHWYR